MHYSIKYKSHNTSITFSFNEEYSFFLFLALFILINFITSIQDSISDISRGSDLSVGSTESPSPNKVAPKRKKTLKTTNAYFYWVTREQGSFDWFKGVMNEVAELDQRV